jgi:hypothetical protein
MKLSEHLTGIGRTIAYYPSVAQVFGVKETIFLCQILFWSDKGEDGWIYRTTEQLEKELGLSYKEQLTVRHNLRQIGVIEEKKGNHKTFYRPNIEFIDRLFTDRKRVDYSSKWVPNQEPIDNMSFGLPIDILSPSECHNGNRLGGVPYIRTEKKTESKEGRSIFEEIYKLYPKKAAAPTALIAIRKSLRKYSSEILLEKTREFAALWAGATDLSFCPNPSTWFNQERFNDDPSTWNRPNREKPQAELRRLESVKDGHVCNREYVGHKADAPQEKKDEYKRIRTRIKELEELIGTGVD